MMLEGIEIDFPRSLPAKALFLLPPLSGASLRVLLQADDINGKAFGGILKGG